MEVLTPAGKAMGGTQGGRAEDRAVSAVAVPAAEAAGYRRCGPGGHGGASGRQRQVYLTVF